MIYNGIRKRLARISLAALLGFGLTAGCGVQNRDQEAFPAESSQEEVPEPFSDSEEFEPEASEADQSASGELVLGEIDFEERRRQQEAELWAWYEALTEEDYAAAKSREELTADDWLIRQLVLLGDLPEAEAKIYGELNGGCLLILEHQGQRRAFYKDFLTPRAVLPEFCVYDYDGDQTMEIGMICYVGSGTGVAIRDFSVFDSVEEPFDALYTMPWEEEQQACDQVWWSYEENVLRIGVGDEYEEHSLADTPFDGMGIRGLALGQITEYYFGESGEVFCDIKLELALEDQATPFSLEEMGDLYQNGVS